MRVGAYRREASFSVKEKQNEALNTTMCILQNYGPMGFLIQEENAKQKFKVFIGERHTCSCKVFVKENDLCKHICWILLKRFRLDRHDPNKFLCHQRFPVTFCRKGCGNNVHIKCMKIWKDHQIKERNLDRFDIVSCPMCRGEFSKLGDLILETTLCENYFAKTNMLVQNTDSLSNSITRDFEVPEEHNCMCTDCNCSPIIGRLYCASDGESFLNIDKSNLLLCSKCFEQRTSGRKISEKWRKIPWNFDILSGFDQHYAENNPRRSVSVWEALTKPLCRKELGRMAKWLIKAAHTSLPKGAALGGTRELGTARGLLTPGRQCRICLMHFREGEEVRKLLRCNHVFHTKCVDQWLLHVSVFSSLHLSLDGIRVVAMLSPRWNNRSAHYPEREGQVREMQPVTCVNSEARSHRDEVRFVTPPLEVKSAAICQSSSTNICTKKTSSTPIRPICKRTQPEIDTKEKNQPDSQAQEWDKKPC
uniref:E3 ubiquitin-protein ligase ZSWIM2 n=1 Tax=Echinococcus canadensis TaxID=519352 RepID=A0A915EXY7_9CEST